MVDNKQLFRALKLTDLDIRSAGLLAASQKIEIKAIFVNLNEERIK